MLLEPFGKSIQLQAAQWQWMPKFGLGGLFATKKVTPFMDSMAWRVETSCASGNISINKDIDKNLKTTTKSLDTIEYTS